jgi:hypothetical protein
MTQELSTQFLILSGVLINAPVAPARPRLQLQWTTAAAASPDFNAQ